MGKKKKKSNRKATEKVRQQKGKYSRDCSPPGAHGQGFAYCFPSPEKRSSAHSCRGWVNSWPHCHQDKVFLQPWPTETHQGLSPSGQDGRCEKGTTISFTAPDHWEFSAPLFLGKFPRIRQGHLCSFLPTAHLSLGIKHWVKAQEMILQGFLYNPNSVVIHQTLKA